MFVCPDGPSTQRANLQSCPEGAGCVELWLSGVLQIKGCIVYV